MAETILLLKNKKQTITLLLMGNMPLCCCYLMALEDPRYTKCCSLLSA